MNSPSYETSVAQTVHGTKCPWYEKSIVRIVQGMNSPPMVRIVQGTNSQSEVRIVQTPTSARMEYQVEITLFSAPYPNHGFLDILPLLVHRWLKDALSEFFSSVFVHKPDSTFISLLKKNVDFVSESLILPEQDILSKSDINKSLGPDLIYPRILCKAKYEISYPLMEDFQLFIKYEKVTRRLEECKYCSNI